MLGEKSRCVASTYAGATAGQSLPPPSCYNTYSSPFRIARVLRAPVLCPCWSALEHESDPLSLLGTKSRALLVERKGQRPTSAFSFVFSQREFQRICTKTALQVFPMNFKLFFQTVVTFVERNFNWFWIVKNGEFVKIKNFVLFSDSFGFYIHEALLYVHWRKWLNQKGIFEFESTTIAVVKFITQYLKSSFPINHDHWKFQSQNFQLIDLLENHNLDENDWKSHKSEWFVKEKMFCYFFLILYKIFKFCIQDVYKIFVFQL